MTGHPLSPWTEPPRCSQRRQRGQALTEFVVLAAVLVPMLLLFPVVSKYVDMMQATEQASRYVAFDGTVNLVGTPQQKSSTTLSTEIGRRFFSRSGTLLLTGEGVTDADAERLPLWHDTWGRAMVDPSSDVGTRVSISNFNAIPSMVLGGSYLAHSEMNLARNRQAVATVSVQPNALPRLAPFDNQNLRFNRTTSVLADAWTASSEDDARLRFSHMRLFNPLGNVREILDIVGTLPTVVADEALTGDGFNGLQGWHTLPCDRLQGGCR